jgi:hypothetical protein
MNSRIYRLTFPPVFDMQLLIYTLSHTHKQATGLSSFGRALKESFQLLNLHRLHNCIDNYGQVCMVLEGRENRPGRVRGERGETGLGVK